MRLHEVADLADGKRRTHERGACYGISFLRWGSRLPIMVVVRFLMGTRLKPRLVLSAMIAVVLAAAVSLLSRLGSGSHHDSRAHEAALHLAAQVASEELDDCEGLAQFIEESAPWNTAATPDVLLNALNEFIPRGKVNYPLGAPIGLIGVEHPVKLEGERSGYRAPFRKGHSAEIPEGLPHDQAHHFAPYLILGATVPAFVTEPFLSLAEEPESWGDINLARKALTYGRMLRNKELTVNGLAGAIRTELCSEK